MRFLRFSAVHDSQGLEACRRAFPYFSGGNVSRSLIRPQAGETSNNMLLHSDMDASPMIES